jgi:POT family proton-dependent oligopeptide transporter
VSTTAAVQGPKPRWPKGIPFIVGNEAAERFSFYGMKSILFVYVSLLLVQFRELGEHDPARLHAEAHATEIQHLFIAGVYAFPMIGAVLADRLFGKFPVIMWVSLIYCAGHAVLAISGDTLTGVYIGLSLIAFGAGGIKPCVSANVGDQFTAENASLVPKVFQIFYFSINFGSFFSSLITPWLYHRYGADIAFGVPGVLMGIATLVFFLGRKKFVKIEPKPGGTLGLMDAIATIALFTPIAMFLFADMLSAASRVAIAVGGVLVWLFVFTARQRKQQDTGFLATVLYCMRNQSKRKAGDGYFDVAREKFGDEIAEGPMAVIKVAIVFSMVTIFWSLFDQHGTTWVNQANHMHLPLLPGWLGGDGIDDRILPSQIAALNPAMVMLVIPFLSFVAYPALEKMGVSITPLRKMSFGMFVAALAFVSVALIQGHIDSSPSKSVHVMWQIIPYIIMTTSEVLVSATGLEFAYTQAPRAMKSTMMGFWLLTVSFGNKLTAVLAGLKDMPLQKLFWICTALMIVAALLFSILSYFYRGKTFMQESES